MLSIFRINPWQIFTFYIIYMSVWNYKHENVAVNFHTSAIWRLCSILSTKILFSKILFTISQSAFPPELEWLEEQGSPLWRRADIIIILTGSTFRNTLIHYTLYFIHYTMYFIHVYIIHYTFYFVLTGSTFRNTLIHYMLYFIHYTLYIVLIHCTYTL